MRKDRYQDVLDAQIWAESLNPKTGQLDPRAVSPAGAKGLAQFMDPTWEDQIRRGVIPADADPFDPQASLTAHRGYMDWLQERPGVMSDEDPEDLAGALAAYNYGMGNVRKLRQRHGENWQEHLPDETKSYLGRISSVVDDPEKLAEVRRQLAAFSPEAAEPVEEAVAEDTTPYTIWARQRWNESLDNVDEGQIGFAPEAFIDDTPPYLKLEEEGAPQIDPENPYHTQSYRDMFRAEQDDRRRAAIDAYAVEFVDSLREDTEVGITEYGGEAVSRSLKGWYDRWRRSPIIGAVDGGVGVTESLMDAFSEQVKQQPSGFLMRVAHDAAVLFGGLFWNDPKTKQEPSGPVVPVIERPKSQAELAFIDAQNEAIAEELSKRLGRHVPVTDLAETVRQIAIDNLPENERDQYYAATSLTDLFTQTFGVENAIRINLGGDRHDFGFGGYLNFGLTDEERGTYVTDWNGDRVFVEYDNPQYVSRSGDVYWALGDMVIDFGLPLASMGSALPRRAGARAIALHSADILKGVDAKLVRAQSSLDAKRKAIGDAVDEVVDNGAVPFLPGVSPADQKKLIKDVMEGNPVTGLRAQEQVIENATARSARVTKLVSQQRVKLIAPEYIREAIENVGISLGASFLYESWEAEEQARLDTEDLSDPDYLRGLMVGTSPVAVGLLLRKPTLLQRLARARSARSLERAGRLEAAFPSLRTASLDETAAAIPQRSLLEETPPTGTQDELFPEGPSRNPAFTVVVRNPPPHGLPGASAPEDISYITEFGITTTEEFFRRNPGIDPANIEDFGVVTFNSEGGIKSYLSATDSQRDVAMLLDPSLGRAATEGVVSPPPLPQGRIPGQAEFDWPAIEADLRSAAAAADDVSAPTGQGVLNLEGTQQAALDLQGGSSPAPRADGTPPEAPVASVEDAAQRSLDFDGAQQTELDFDGGAIEIVTEAPKPAAAAAKPKVKKVRSRRSKKSSENDPEDQSAVEAAGVNSRPVEASVEASVEAPAPVAAAPAKKAPAKKAPAKKAPAKKAPANATVKALAKAEARLAKAEEAKSQANREFMTADPGDEAAQEAYDLAIREVKDAKAALDKLRKAAPAAAEPAAAKPAAQAAEPVAAKPAAQAAEPAPAAQADAFVEPEITGFKKRTPEGEYEGTVNGHTFKIYRDPADGGWRPVPEHEDIVYGAKSAEINRGGQMPVGYTKAAALEALGKKPALQAKAPAAPKPKAGKTPPKKAPAKKAPAKKSRKKETEQEKEYRVLRDEFQITSKDLEGPQVAEVFKKKLRNLRAAVTRAKNKNKLEAGPRQEWHLKEHVKPLEKKLAALEELQRRYAPVAKEVPETPEAAAAASPTGRVLTEAEMKALEARKKGFDEGGKDFLVRQAEERTQRSRQGGTLVDKVDETTQPAKPTNTEVPTTGTRVVGSARKELRTVYDEAFDGTEDMHDPANHQVLEVIVNRKSGKPVMALIRESRDGAKISKTWNRKRSKLTLEDFLKEYGVKEYQYEGSTPGKVTEGIIQSDTRTGTQALEDLAKPRVREHVHIKDEDKVRGLVLRLGGKARAKKDVKTNLYAVVPTENDLPLGGRGGIIAGSPRGEIRDRHVSVFKNKDTALAAGHSYVNFAEFHRVLRRSNPEEAVEAWMKRERDVGLIGPRSFMPTAKNHKKLVDSTRKLLRGDPNLSLKTIFEQYMRLRAKSAGTPSFAYPYRTPKQLSPLFAQKFRRSPETYIPEPQQMRIWEFNPKRLPTNALIVDDIKGAPNELRVFGDIISKERYKLLDLPGDSPLLRLGAKRLKNVRGATVDDYTVPVLSAEERLNMGQGLGARETPVQSGVQYTEPVNRPRLGGRSKIPHSDVSGPGHGFGIGTAQFHHRPGQEGAFGFGTPDTGFGGRRGGTHTTYDPLRPPATGPKTPPKEVPNDPAVWNRNDSQAGRPTEEVYDAAIADPSGPEAQAVSDALTDVFGLQEFATKHLKGPLKTVMGLLDRLKHRFSDSDNLFFDTLNVAKRSKDAFSRVTAPAWGGPKSIGSRSQATIRRVFGRGAQEREQLLRTHLAATNKQSKLFKKSVQEVETLFGELWRREGEDYMVMVMDAYESKRPIPAPKNMNLTAEELREAIHLSKKILVDHYAEQLDALRKVFFDKKKQPVGTEFTPIDRYGEIYIPRFYDLPETMRTQREMFKKGELSKEQFASFGGESGRRLAGLEQIHKNFHNIVASKYPVQARKGGRKGGVVHFSGAFDELGSMYRLGYRPATYNPITLMRMKSDQLANFLMRARLVEELEAQGLVTKVDKTKFETQQKLKVQAGIEDNKQFTVDIDSDLNDIYSWSKRGRSKLPEQIFVSDPTTQRLLQNHFSPGLLRSMDSSYPDESVGKEFLQNWRKLNNLGNTTQLGLGFFHLGVMAVASVESNFQLALAKGGRALSALPLGRVARSGELRPYAVDKLGLYYEDLEILRRKKLGRPLNQEEILEVAKDARRKLGLETAAHLMKTVPGVGLLRSAGRLPTEVKVPMSSGWSSSPEGKKIRILPESLDDRSFRGALVGMDKRMAKLFGDGLAWKEKYGTENGRLFTTDFFGAADTVADAAPLGKVLDDMYKGVLPSNQYDPTISKLVSYISDVNGRGAGYSAEYQKVMDKSFREAVEDVRRAGNELDANWGKVLLKSPGKGVKVASTAAVEGIEDFSRYLFERTIPYAKLAAFTDLARYEVMKLGKDVDPDVLNHRLMRAWDSIDNRFGMMVYDNLFLKKTHKDMLFLIQRAPGWNWGTKREIFGGAADAVKWTALKGKRGFERITEGKPITQEVMGIDDFTPRAGYVLSIVSTTAMMSAMYQYALTGEMPEYDEDQDWWENFRRFVFPLNGQIRPDGTPERSSWPTYMKDIFAYLKDFPYGFFETLTHKAAPLISIVGDQVRGEDYFGNQITDPSDSVAESLYHRGKHAAKGLMPFSLQLLIERMVDQGMGPGHAFFEYFTGITQAPAAFRLSQAENLLTDEFARSLPSGGKTRSQQAQMEARAQYRLGIIQGDKARMKEARTEFLEQGGSPRSLGRVHEQVSRGVTVPTIGLRFAKVRWGSADRLLEFVNASTPEELQSVGAGQLLKSWNESLRRMPINRREELNDEFKEVAKAKLSKQFEASPQENVRRKEQARRVAMMREAQGR